MNRKERRRLKVEERRKAKRKTRPVKLPLHNHDFVKPLGVVRSAASLGGRVFYHLSVKPLSEGIVLTLDYIHRPHLVFFVEPPPTQLLGDSDKNYTNFLADRRVEKTLEQVRVAQFDNAPSRNCLYAFSCFRCAIDFRERARKSALLYEVTIRGDAWCADMAIRELMSQYAKHPDLFIQQYPNVNLGVRLAELAIDYWSGVESHTLDGQPFKPEFFVPGELVVGKQIA